MSLPPDHDAEPMSQSTDAPSLREKGMDPAPLPVAEEKQNKDAADTGGSDGADLAPPTNRKRESPETRDPPAAPVEGAPGSDEGERPAKMAKKSAEPSCPLPVAATVHGLAGRAARAMVADPFALCSFAATCKAVRGGVGLDFVVAGRKQIQLPRNESNLDPPPTIQQRVAVVKSCNSKLIRKSQGWVDDLTVMRAAGLEDVSHFVGVRHLSLIHAGKLQSLPPSLGGGLRSFSQVGCKELRDVASLAGVRYVDLSGTSVQDASALGGVHALNLAGTGVTDVSALGGVHTLVLRNTKVSDVAALGKVHALDLSGTLVEDVSALGKVHSLILKRTRAKDVSALTDVHLLDLEGTRVEDASALGNAHELNLSRTPVRDASALGKVHVLDLSYTNVSNAAALGAVHTLDLTGSKVTSDWLLDDVVALSYTKVEEVAMRRVVYGADGPELERMLVRDNVVRVKNGFQKAEPRLKAGVWNPWRSIRPGKAAMDACEGALEPAGV